MLAYETDRRDPAEAMDPAFASVPSKNVTAGISSPSATDRPAGTLPELPAAEVETAKLAQAWVTVVGLSAARLGPNLASEAMLSTVLSALEG